jgi:spoIIIJ-associated protein
MAVIHSDANQTDIVESARKFLAGILDRMDIDAEIEIFEEEDKFVLDIKCDNVERIIGRRGQVMDALQHLVGKMSYRDRAMGARSKPIVIDAGGYRDKHIERLESLAERMGTKAIRTQTIIELDPMTPHDRRIVHLALAEMEGVTTRSEGEGDDRRVLVVPLSSRDQAAVE